LPQPDCPKCQGRPAPSGFAARQAELLAVPYFRRIHLPAAVAEIAFHNKATVYAHPVPNGG